MGTKLKTIIDSPCGIRHIVEHLEIQSSFSRRLLMDSAMALSKHKIEAQYGELTEFIDHFGSTASYYGICTQIKSQLTEIRDVRLTISRLSDGGSLDDIELFELKNLALISENVREIFHETTLKCITLPDLSGVVDALDPEKQKIQSFYIYDSYDAELSRLRKTLRSGTEYNEEHLYRAATIETKVRTELVVKLKPTAQNLNDALQQLAKIDILLAKILQNEKLNLTIPTIGNNKNSYQKLFNPEVKSLLEQVGKEFQPIDIEFDTSTPLLITGANMGGKSITLKTLALAQYMFQFGFGIPASSATITPVSEVKLSIGDDQNIQKGLSSFAAEMLRIDEILKMAKESKHILALIDEPASTTNPLEGTALVTSLIKILNKQEVLTVITTHYNIENVDCERLRVRGFENNKMNYSLIHDTGTPAPREALRIAASLGVDQEWITTAEKELE